jgi:hypothetical protein
MEISIEVSHKTKKKNGSLFHSLVYTQKNQSITDIPAHCIDDGTVYNSQVMESAYVPPNERIQKIWCKYTVEYCSSIKENEIMSFAGKQMKLEIPC